MKLYRYELYCDEEPQDVGLLVGLQDLGLSCETEEELLEPFDLRLTIPDLPGMRGSASFFTAEGHSRFQADIFRVAAAFKDSIFDIMRCCLELPESYLDSVVYRDANQVCISRELYYGELDPLVSKEMVSLDPLLGESFRMRNPVLIGDIYHVGTMDISKKSNYSHEGDGLSISNCPDEWVEITEGFTYGDYFRLSKPDMKLLDYYGLTDGEKSEIQRLALENGYVEEATLYKSISYGEFGDDEYFSLYDNYDDALEEADGDEECVEEVDGLIPTQKLRDRSLVKIDLLMVRDVITALYAEQVLGYDGIWWDEELDVGVYSAPRGVIFNSRVSSFDVVNTTQINKEPLSLDAQIQSASNRAAEFQPTDKTPVKEITFEH